MKKGIITMSIIIVLLYSCEGMHSSNDIEDRYSIYKEELHSKYANIQRVRNDILIDEDPVAEIQGIDDPIFVVPD